MRGAGRQMELIMMIIIIIIVIIIAITRRFYDVVVWRPKPFREFIWWMQTVRRVAAKPQTKPIDLGCESASRLLLSTSTVAIVIITQPVSWYSFCRPTERGMLSRPRHCSKSSQPVPKAVYRSGRRDKHNHRRCDSSPSALTPKSLALAVAEKLHGV